MFAFSIQQSLLLYDLFHQIIVSNSKKAIFSGIDSYQNVVGMGGEGQGYKTCWVCCLHQKNFKFLDATVAPMDMSTSSSPIPLSVGTSTGYNAVIWVQIQPPACLKDSMLFHAYSSLFT